MTFALRGFLLLAGVTACSGGDAPADADSAARETAAVSQARGPATTITAAGQPCVLAELWSPCLLTKALENAGLAPIEGDSVHYPFFRVGGRRWQVGGRAELQTFIYPSTERLRADLAGFDTARAQPRSGGDRIDWSMRPETIVSRNLLVLLSGGTDRQRERIRNAIEAGLLGLRPR